MKFSKINFGLLLAVAVANAAEGPIGWGKNTTGGKGGVEYHVNSYKELKDALNNNGNPNGPKIIYIESPINGAEDDNGHILTAEELVPGFSFQKYLDCFTEDGTTWLDTEECNKINELRLEGAPKQANQIMVRITPNTTLIGTGNDSILEEMSIQITETENVIIKNLSVEAPNDLFPEWDPTDGIHGSWNAEYDAIVVNNSTNVWVDNCYLSDGKKGVDTTPITFGKYIEFHDGLLDIVNSADYVTVSNNRFENHQKTSLIGNSDSRTTDRDHLKVTIHNNVYINCDERLPRVRFGKVHVYNNYFYSETFNPGYPALTVNNYFHDDAAFPQYMIGLGVESNVLSEVNSFNYVGNDEIPATDDIVVYSYGGYIFHDNGSEFNGKNLDFDKLAEESFKLKVKTKMAQNAAAGKKNPVWVNATFTTETFEPREFYDYELIDIDSVNDLINKVPTWMFENDNKVGNDEVETEADVEEVSAEVEKDEDSADEDSAVEVDVDAEIEDAEDSAEESN
ncbi:pectin lyase-like protein [Neocallimastix lanati (nom. inval.)]|jgi:pectate lyase|uniref:Pectin lyase-like protein n=1 Tax=Neocallimastix californiae TaxID=1754190 RepID=A0A1Y2FRD0_9FUNG|nr:pectin lyase-like protein [Neocallimastix sp. JGI-2020a]ORY86572.1 pectin lyase-like protein [Neocallimastix californiae]|eukprot:ORY86572.1 pectin lyase-like protein [Neocallimastix californiae]